METFKEEKSIENQPKSSKIPRGVPFVLCNILLERYCMKGICSIFLLYLNRKLKFDSSVSTSIFHSIELSSYLATIFGAIIADSYFGLHKTITWMSLVFSIGSGILCLGSIELLNLPARFLTILGYLLAAFGSGSIRANLNTFGANQYKLPEQADQMKFYFSLQILFIKSGNLLGQFTNPILRERVRCFGSDDCYPLPYGIASAAIIFAFLTLFIGKSLFIRVPPGKNMIVKVSQCITRAVIEKFRTQRTTSRDHWLDYAIEKHGTKLVAETKTFANIFVLYLPLPIYWAVYSQQMSRWVFQATRMNRDFGFFTLLPDQIAVLSPLLVILTIPLCDFAIYPILKKFKIETLLQKMTIGGFLAVIGISISALIESKINGSFITVLWLVPQYFLIALSENFLFVSHLNFVYTEASANMKSVMTASVYVICAFGNLFVVLISGMRIFESQVIEFLFYAGILSLATIIFGLLASKYKSSDREKIEDESGEKSNLMNECEKIDKI